MFIARCPTWISKQAQLTQRKYAMKHRRRFDPSRIAQSILGKRRKMALKRARQVKRAYLEAVR